MSLALHISVVTIALSNPVKFLRGVGPHRAALLEERGIFTVADLLAYLPFRYEDRIRFTPIAEIIPGQPHTILVEVANAGGTIRFARGRGGVFHIAVRDGSGTLYARFFHGSYLEGKFKQGQRLVMHGKVDADPHRPGRLEMVNPQIELIGNADGAPADSTEVGRIVPIYEAIGGISSRMLRRIIYCGVERIRRQCARPSAAEIRERYRFPARREALLYAHFPTEERKIELLNSFRSPGANPADFRGVFLLSTRARTAASARTRPHRNRDAGARR